MRLFEDESDLKKDSEKEMISLASSVRYTTTINFGSLSNSQADFIFFSTQSNDQNSFPPDKLVNTYMNRIAINETDSNEVLGVYQVQSGTKNLEEFFCNHKNFSRYGQKELSEGKGEHSWCYFIF